MDPQYGVFGWLQPSAGRLGCQVWITVAADLVGNLGKGLRRKQGRYDLPARTFLPIRRGWPRLEAAPMLGLTLVGLLGGEGRSL